MNDALFVMIVMLFFLSSCGFVALCQRLMEK